MEGATLYLRTSNEDIIIYSCDLHTDIVNLEWGGCEQRLSWCSS